MPVLQGVAAAPSPTHHPQYPLQPLQQQLQHQGYASQSHPPTSHQATANSQYPQPQQGYQHARAQQPTGTDHNALSAARQRQEDVAPAMNRHQMPINAAQLQSQAGPSGQNLAGLAPGTLMPTTAASLIREGPRDFTVIKAVGDGSFGTVSLADWKSPLPSGTMLSPMQHPTTRPEYVGKRLVAIKRMKKPFKAWADCMKLKELKSLLDIPHHPNIIPLYDAFLDPTSKELHFVFECMEGNLYQLTKSRKGRPLASGLVASIFQQIILGLDHIHKHGYFHRDMKPENLLITTTGLDDYPSTKVGAPPERDVIVIVKLADFGLARETASKPPYTEYVSTRWYRAPEVLLRSRDYSNPVDMWALGTILAELVNLKPLFPGESEVDQVLQICEVLGNPSSEYGTDSKGRVRGGGPWERGIRMAAGVGFQWPKSQPIKFASLFSSRVPMELIGCIEDLLRYDPAVRATTFTCMNHPYFTQIAPRLHPLKGRPPAIAAARPPAAPPADALAPEQSQPPPMAVDPTAQRDTLPPSHSNTASTSRPAFGEGQMANFNRVPFYRPQQQQQQGQGIPEDRSEDGPRFYRSGPATDPNAYPAFPQSASIQSVDSQQSGMTIAQDGRTQLHPSHVNDRTMGEPTPVQAPTPAAPHQVQQQQQQQQQERKKGWGMSIFSGAGGHAQQAPSQMQEQQSFAPGSRNPSLALSRPSLQTQPGSPLDESRPGATESAVSMDPKKAKKEAEKAAKQAEKAKRNAQEKAARDRARAVMQKRNQILAASTIKEQVEWLSNSSPPGQPSEKARGKQPLQPPSLSPSQSPLSSFNTGASGGDSLSSPLTPYSPSSGVYSPGLYGPARQQAVGGGGNGHVPPHLMEMRDPRRPISVQSYQTGDSDPGPQGRRPMPGYPNALQRQSSASSLSSGLDIMAQQQQPSPYLPHHQGRYYHGQYPGHSVESLRSAPDMHTMSSLDPQLVSNMANMTAAERHSGSASPAPLNHMVGPNSAAAMAAAVGGAGLPRQSGKTRSRASSIQRAGSASPLHHPIVPRFHPYGLAGHPPASSHSQSSSHSQYSGIHLPSLQLSLEDEQRRTRSHSNAAAAGGSRTSAAGRRRSSLSQHRPNMSRGSVGSNSAWIADGTGGIPIHSPTSSQPPSMGHQYHYRQQQHSSGGERAIASSHSGGHGYPLGSSSHSQHVNPMWGGSGGFQQGPSSVDSRHQMPASGEAAMSMGQAQGQGPGVSSLAADTRLPPFSSLMAAADANKGMHEVDEEDAEMVMEDPNATRRADGIRMAGAAQAAGDGAPPPAAMGSYRR